MPAELAKKFSLGRELGKGAYGTVHLIHECKTCTKYAIKRQPIDPLDFSDIEDCEKEAEIMKQRAHPCIVNMYNFIVVPDKAAYITLEYMKGGQLLARIRNQKFLPEANAKHFFYQMCSGIKYLHDNKITHRDLKPENMLLACERKNILLKIADFGTSKLLKHNSALRTFCGTVP